MDITAKKYNLLRLWLESFAVVNRSTGKLLGAILCSVLLVAVILAVLMFGVGTTAVLAKFQMALLSKAVGIGTLLVYIGAVILSNLYGIFFLTICWQIVANSALQRKLPLTETFSSSVLPTIYQLIAGILLAIPYVLAGIVLAIGAKATPWLVLVGMLLIFLVGVRLCYAFIGIAIDHKGPIEGLVHSWKLTAGKDYLDALLMCLILVGSVLLLEATYLGIGYALYVLIPLHFASSFSLAHLSLVWWLLGFVLVVVGVFVYFSLLTFPVLVFLNRNTQLYTEQAQQQEEIFIPLPDLDLPQDVSAEQPVQPAPPPPPASTTPSAAPLPPTMPAMQETLDTLQVTQTSVNTSEQDANDITQHLHQVYTPKQEEVRPQLDEDRMPTILFDDELAKQLQEQALDTPKPETHRPDDTGMDTIKMSK